MKSELLVLALGAVFAAGAADIVIENDALRLVLAEEGHAKSLVAKATGDELLQPGVHLPFATLTQERPYDNEYKLMLPAKPWTHPANRIVRTGDELRISFADEFDIAVVTLDIKPSYIGFRLARVDYRFEDFGDKRRTEIDSLEIVRLALRNRAHFGRILNCTWDDRTACALIAGNVSTRVDAFAREDGARTFTAGSDERVNLLAAHAILVAGAQPRFLDAIDSVERDLGLPRGVASRRRADYAASYYFTLDFSPATVDRHIAAARQMGFRTLMTCLTQITRSDGTYPYRDTFPNGDADLTACGAKIRAAGLAFGLHAYPCKASTNDAYLASGTPDPRFATVCELTLAEAASATADTLLCEGNPHLLRRERNRGLILADGELILYDRVEATEGTRPFRLTGCRRGLWHSPAKPHARHTTLRHLDVDDWPLYVRFDPDTAIQDEVAARIARFWRVGGFSFMYWDGSEDVPKPFWHYVPRAQETVYKRLDPAPVYCETALKSHWGWHMMSRGNAFDVFQPERLRAAFKKYVLRTARQDADDFSSVNFGWLRMRLPERHVGAPRASQTQFTRHPNVNTGLGMQPDAFEYAASKALAWNAPLALQVAMTHLEHPRFADNAAVLKAWEDAKLGHAFTAAQREELKDPDREFFFWPFGGKPAYVEWRSETTDTERPWRIFSYERAGRSGVVCWHILDRDAPAPVVPDVPVQRAQGRFFYESDAPRAAFVKRLRAHLNGADRAD